MMKRIFKENAIKIKKLNNALDNNDNFIIKIEYNDYRFKKEYVIELSFDKNGNIKIRIENLETKKHQYIISYSRDDKEALGIIMNALESKTELYFNFNPFIHGIGVMLFFNNSNGKIRGIGLDKNDKYVMQIEENDVKKYNNNIKYITI